MMRVPQLPPRVATKPVITANEFPLHEHGVHGDDQNQTERPKKQHKLTPTQRVLWLVLCSPDCYLIADLLRIIKEYVQNPPPVRRKDLIDEHKQLGRGETGVVRLVRHAVLGRLYACKCIPIMTDADGLEEVEAIAADASSAASRHNSVVRIEGLFVRKSKFYQIKEYMNRGSLADLLRVVGGALPEKIVAYIARQLCQTLLFIHKKKIVRNLAPTRVLLNSTGEVKINHLKRVCIYDLNKAGRYKLNPYTAPEAVQRNRQTAVDVWSLGTIIAELCIGKTISRQFGTFAKMFELPSNCSTGACTWVNSCVKPDASARATISDLLKHGWLHNNNVSQQEFAAWLGSIQPSTDGAPASPH
eukprot:TRINITY_DN69419_c0_g1_i1.p1 TRINITY_DN69419_c0_g1~~TRINITY_DN69419_c0_g1_i1.p1  ORF type:complete len:359 (-),score=12.15 TRINITY_DN69419_c0_g1_i1:97-1173(-)